jgi:hypothetical protein
MKWIVERVEQCRSFRNVTHRQIWNSVWNGCIYPADEPRFRQIVTEDETLFIANKKAK